MYCFLSR